MTYFIKMVISRKQYKTETSLLWMTNRTSYVLYRIAPSAMSLTRLSTNTRSYVGDNVKCRRNDNTTKVLYVPALMLMCHLFAIAKFLVTFRHAS